MAIRLPQMMAILACAWLASGAAAADTHYRGPIIDVHLHGYTGEIGSIPMRTFRFLPEQYATQTSPQTGELHLRETLRLMRDHNIVLGFVSAGHQTDQLALAKAWREAGGDQIRAGFAHHEPAASLGRQERAELEAAIRSGQIAALAEIAPQYLGLSASDSQFDPYFALAERLDVPVGIHTGTAPPRQANRRAPAFRTHLGDPRLVEEVLVKYPKLRVWLMHAGWPYLAETKVILQQYPEVYVDVGAISWLQPRAEFHNYLKALIDAGYGDRVMFGSDQMYWPQAIPRAIEGVASAPFLTPQQKSDIFYNNAARFFRLALEGEDQRK